MRALSELVVTTTIQTSIDVALAPKKYESTTPYADTIKNAFTAGVSSGGEKVTSFFADKLFKSATKRGNIGLKVTETVGCL